MTAILATDNLSIEFGGVRAVDGVTLSVKPGEIVSIIGPNGAGKTTLFNLISGLYRPSRGRVMLEGREVTAMSPYRLARLGMSRTFQNLQVFFRMSAIENVMVGHHIHENRNVLAHFLGLPGRARSERATRASALELLGFVGLADEADRPAGVLPYGALKRLEISRALAAKPKILLLDEPAAGCNAKEAEEIVGIIRKVCSTGTAILLIEHNIRLVMDVSHHIVVLNYGRMLSEGTADRVRTDPAVIEAYLGRKAQGRDHDARST
jgi:branched-chain amino acid transport system ATP-binding protein